MEQKETNSDPQSNISNNTKVSEVAVYPLAVNTISIEEIRVSQSTDLNNVINDSHAVLNARVSYSSVEQQQDVSTAQNISWIPLIGRDVQLELC